MIWEKNNIYEWKVRGRTMESENCRVHWFEVFGVNKCLFCHLSWERSSGERQKNVEEVEMQEEEVSLWCVVFGWKCKRGHQHSFSISYDMVGFHQQMSTNNHIFQLLQSRHEWPPSTFELHSFSSPIIFSLRTIPSPPSTSSTFNPKSISSC